MSQKRYIVHIYNYIHMRFHQIFSKQGIIQSLFTHSKTYDSPETIIKLKGEVQVIFTFIQFFQYELKVVHICIAIPIFLPHIPIVR